MLATHVDVGSLQPLLAFLNRRISLALSSIWLERMADTPEEYILTSLTARRVALTAEAEAALHRPRVNWIKLGKYAPS